MENVASIVVAWARTQNLKVNFQASVTSTNDLAREDGTADLYVCEHQTKGRGRGTNVWTDRGQGQLLASWSWTPKGTPQPMITPRLGLALYRAAIGTWNESGWSLKAPNDLFLHGKKVAGLLVEAVTQGSNVRIVIGLGLNVTTAPDLPTACALDDYYENDVLSERSFRDFLSRWQLEMKLVCDAPDAELAPHDHAALAGALIRNPANPRVSALEKDGTIRYEDGTTKKWMEL